MAFFFHTRSLVLATGPQKDVLNVAAICIRSIYLPIYYWYYIFLGPIHIFIADSNITLFLMSLSLTLHIMECTTTYNSLQNLTFDNRCPGLLSLTNFNTKQRFRNRTSFNLCVYTNNTSCYNLLPRRYRGYNDPLSTRSEFDIFSCRYYSFRKLISKGIEWCGRGCWRGSVIVTLNIIIY